MCCLHAFGAIVKLSVIIDGNIHAHAHVHTIIDIVHYISRSNFVLLKECDDSPRNGMRGNRDSCLGSDWHCYVVRVIVGVGNW